MILLMLGAATGQVALAQSAPPIKMGLWADTATVTTTTHLPPEVAAKINAPGGVMTLPPRVINTNICHTAADWTRSIAGANQAKNCTMTNKVVTAKGMSMDMTCTVPNQGTSTGHIDAVFDSPEQVHSTVHMAFTGAPKAQNGAGMSTTVDIKSESHYVSADCGDVKPLEPQSATKP